MNFAIQPVAGALQAELQRRIDQASRPPGALGMLERLALRIGLIQNTLTPQLQQPTIALFAGDHGALAEGISTDPAAVTAQTVLALQAGGGASHVFAHANGLKLVLVDVGVDYDFPDDVPLIRAKVARSTRNYVVEPAMTRAQCEQALANGAAVVSQLHRDGCNIVGFGEIGSGSSASAALLMSLFCQLPLERCTGIGARLDAAGAHHRLQVLKHARERVDGNRARRNPIGLLAEFGGFEIAAICGGMLRAAELGMIVLIDGFVTGSALLAARALHPSVVDYCIASHRSDEPGHSLLLQQLHGYPLLDLRLRLGEGIGVALAYPLVRAAVAFLNDAASADKASSASNRHPS